MFQLVYNQKLDLIGYSFSNFNIAMALLKNYKVMQIYTNKVSLE